MRNGITSAATSSALTGNNDKIARIGICGSFAPAAVSTKDYVNSRNFATAGVSRVSTVWRKNKKKYWNYCVAMAPLESIANIAANQRFWRRYSFSPPYICMASFFCFSRRAAARCLRSAKSFAIATS